MTISGMLVNGFVVRSTNHYEGEPITYGLFPTVESAEAWALQMTIPIVIEPVYAPVYNRG